MKVDIRQIEETSSQMEKRLRELREVLDMIADVRKSLKQHPVGNQTSSMQIEFSLMKEEAVLLKREAGLMMLANALRNAVQDYKACEQKALKHSAGGTSQTRARLELDPERFLDRFGRGAIDVSEFRKTIESLISPFVI